MAGESEMIESRIWTGREGWMRGKQCDEEGEPFHCEPHE
jgi:hypothetical protein